MRFWNTPVLILFWVLLTIFLGRFFMLGQAIYGDGIYYWAYVRSIVIDHDLDLHNEASHNYSPHGNNMDINPDISPKSLVENKYYPIGPSLMWTPAFLLAHSLSRPLNLPDNGFADHYQIAVGIMNVSFVLIGVVLIYRLIEKHYSPFIAVITACLMLFATNLIYYGSLDILNSHPSSFFISSILITLLFSLRERYRDKYFFIGGLLIGLLTLIRPQDILFGILFLPFLFGRNLQILPKRIILLGLGILLMYLPQLITSHTVFNAWYVLPYFSKGTADTFSPLQPHILDLFFDKNQGLLFFCPVYIMSIIGLILYKKHNRSFASVFLLLLLSEIFLISIWSGWSQGEAFGLRMLISQLPIFAFGIAELIKISKKYLSNTAIIVIGLLFILQNMFMILSFHLFLHQPTFINGELSPGGKLREEIREKLTDIVPRKTNK